MSISTRLLLAFLVILVPMALLGAYGIHNNLQLQREQIVSGNLETARATGAAVDNFVQNVESLLLALSKDDAVQAVDAPGAELLFRRVKPSIPYLADILMTDVRGNVVASAVPTSGPTNLADRDYFQEALASNLGVSDSYVGRITGLTLVAVAIPIRDESDRVMGVIAAPISLEFLNEELGPTFFGGTSLRYLVDSKGAALVHPRREYFLEQKSLLELPPVQEVVAGREGSLEYFSSIENVQRLGSYVPVPRTGWGVVVSRDAEEAFTPTRDFLVQAVPVVAGFFIVAIGLAFWLARRIARPVQRLTFAAEQVARGDLEQVVPVTSQDEVGRLGDAFNKMTLMLHLSYRRLQAQVRQQETLLKLSQELLANLGEERIFELALSAVGKLIQADSYEILLPEAEQTLRIRAARGFEPKEVLGMTFGIEQSMAGYTYRQRQPVIANDLNHEERFPVHPILRELQMRSAVAVPVVSGDRCFGVLVAFSREAGRFEEEAAASLSLVANQMGLALERTEFYTATKEFADNLEQSLAELKEAEQRIRRQVQRLGALRTIDMAITASLDLRVTLNVILDQVTAQLRVDAADILLLNPHMQTLEYGAGRGFRTAALQATRLRLGEGHAGRAALERRIVSIPNLAEAPGEFTRAPLLAREEFSSYHGVPLVAKGQVKGILEIFHRAPLNPDPEWLSFLEALAGQAAIAIDNASLFDDLQRSNLDLSLAYDTTLEGWSRALDLRDEETEGHTQRVAEITAHLARAMGLSDEELVHVRRGALLHDIGKMGVPDGILLKPGPLTEEEWEVMRKHPVYAYELLSPIPYLHPALDIPYGHHEKWDGTGYPRGLKMEQIPLAARIFAVVDVWDALSSDRPYRPAWPEDKVREYIREQAGKHFDPKVVEVFLELVAAPKAPAALERSLTGHRGLEDAGNSLQGMPAHDSMLDPPGV